MDGRPRRPDVTAPPPTSRRRRSRLACAAVFAAPVLAMGVRSHWRRDILYRTAPAASWLHVESMNGDVAVYRRPVTSHLSDFAGPSWVYAASPARPANRPGRWPGIVSYVATPTGRPAYRVVGVAYWLLTGMAAGVGAAVARPVSAVAGPLWRRAQREIGPWLAEVTGRRH